MHGAQALDILIVDDLAVVRMLTSETLRAAGCARIREAANIAEAHARMTERAANVLLVDRSMPGGDGVEFIAELRADARYDACAMILVTGFADERVANAACGAGADAVLEKPVETENLLTAIENAVAARSRAARAAARS